jgi:hypothetical protein
VSFLWVPGTVPDEDAIARMRTYIPRPVEAMGEAWFNTKERKFHRELMAAGAATMPFEKIYPALWDIASGTGCFGHQEEWDAWLRYLLPDLIDRSHERYAFDFLLEHTITAFIAVFWTGISEVYLGFQGDVLRTLGQALMKPALWKPDPTAPTNSWRSIPIFLRSEERGEEVLYGWRCSEAPGSLAAAMTFCLKYLPAEDLRPWAGALFDINHPHWRLAVLVWYVGAQRLRERPRPTPSDIERANPAIKWQNSHVLKSEWGTVAAKFPPHPDYNDNGDFLDPERVQQALDAMREQITIDRLAAWEVEFWQDPLLAAQADLPVLLDKALATVAA